MKIDIRKIDADPTQPRKKFDPVALGELAASIEANGQIQAITVRQAGRRFIIIAGERRWRAHALLADGGKARFSTINATVVDGNDAAAILVAQIVENVQRADMDPFEEAQGYARLRDDHGMTPAEIAQRTGVVPFRVEWRLRLLHLSPELRQLAEAEQIDRQTAMEVARLPIHADQRRVVQMVNRRELVGWKAVRNAIDAILGDTMVADMFGDAAAAAGSRREQLETLRGMEARIDQVVRAINGGWRDGECIIATMVDPGRARTLAEKLAHLRKTIITMERELQNLAAQATIVQQGALV